MSSTRTRPDLSNTAAGEVWSVEAAKDRNKKADDIPSLENLSLIANPQPAPARLSLLGLPPELRLCIYDFLPMRPIPQPSEKNQRDATQFAVLHVSKQVYYEAKPALYGNISIDSSHLKHIPAHAIEYVKTVRVLCRYDNLHGWHCDPALTQFNTARCWPLENLWRYLGQAFPGVCEIRLNVTSVGPRPEQSAAEDDLADAEAENVPKPALMVLPALQRVALGSCGSFDGLSADWSRGPWFEELKAEVERLSRGAVVMRA